VKALSQLAKVAKVNVFHRISPTISTRLSLQALLVTFGQLMHHAGPCPLSLALKVIKNWQVFEFLPWPIQFRSRNANPLT
jgi:hypothetical protein